MLFPTYPLLFKSTRGQRICIQRAVRQFSTSKNFLFLFLKTSIQNRKYKFLPFLLILEKRELLFPYLRIHYVFKRAVNVVDLPLYRATRGHQGAAENGSLAGRDKNGKPRAEGGVEAA